MKLPFFLLKRYLRFDKNQPFISISAILSFLGVMLGVAVLIVTMAVMNGLYHEFESRLTTMNYPLTVKSYEGVDSSILQSLEKEFSDLEFSPYILTQGAIKNGSKFQGALIFGVDFKNELKMNDILKSAVKETPQKFSIVVGDGVAESNNLEVGDKVLLMFSDSDPSGFELMPRMKKFKLNSTFNSGLQSYDSSYAYVNIEDLSKVLRYEKGHYDGIHVNSQNPRIDKKRLEDFLGFDVDVIGWWQYNVNFFAALQTEKTAMFIILMMIILIASLNIISSLLMLVMNRRKDIALLLSLGASPKEIKKTFFYLGSVIGGGGIVAGILLSLIVLYVLGNFDIITLPKDIYPTSSLPIDLSIIDLGMIVGGSIVIIILSSLYPAYKASKTDVLQILRNE